MDRNQELCGRYLVSLLSSVFNEKQPQEIPEALSFEELFKLAEAHQVSVMALAAVEKLTKKPEPDLFAKWQDAKGLHAFINVAQILELDRLLKSFSSEGIRAVPLKGCLLKFIYPCTEYRQMGDLDILIDEKDAEKARTVMETLGYHTKYFDVGHHDYYLRDPLLIVELHRTLFDPKSDLLPFFKDIWDRVLPDDKSDHAFRLSDEDFYLFLITHLEKHFHNSGSGIKSIMDIAIFLNVYSDSLDWAYINRELIKLGLVNFHETVKQLSMAWFQGEPYRDFARQMERDLFSSGGVYGSRQRYLENRVFQTQKRGKLRYILRSVFLPFRQLKFIYPVLRAWPVLYPALLLHRLFVKRRKGIEEMRYINKAAR